MTGLNIHHLILKHILGSLTPEEAEDLRIWREADTVNEQLFQKTIQTEFLEGEWLKRQSVNYERPLADMQRRIAQGNTKPIAHKAKLWPLMRVAATAALVIAMGVLTYLYFNQSSTNEMAVIKAGEMKATLQVLSSDETSAPLPVLPCKEGAVTTSDLLADYQSQVSSYRTNSTAKHTPSSLSLTTPRGGEFRVTLEDGTEVWLNAQSRLIYPETFSQDERRVSVEGEAYFRVARDEHKPFIVETDGQLIQVLGTEFNVHSYAEDKTVETTLVKGSIAMKPADTGDAHLVLTPGHQAIFDKSAHDINVRSVNTEVVTSWREGKFVFENQTLEQLMLTLSRWYDFTYEFADVQAASTVFMGRIPRYADFDDVIAILESSGGLKVSVKGSNVIVRSEK